MGLIINTHNTSEIYDSSLEDFQHPVITDLCFLYSFPHTFILQILFGHLLCARHCFKALRIQWCVMKKIPTPKNLHSLK